jgi:hypothetical protein
MPDNYGGATGRPCGRPGIATQSPQRLNRTAGGERLEAAPELGEPPLEVGDAGGEAVHVGLPVLVPV